jgi:hypothetical protein
MSVYENYKKIRQGLSEHCQFNESTVLDILEDYLYNNGKASTVATNSNIIL